ncbi:MAG: SPASM domain-containing protein [archaeon]
MKLEDVHCLKPWYNMAIKHDGRTGVCGLTGLFAEEGDNIRDRPLLDIWRGEFFARKREEGIKGKLSSHCNKCAPSDVTQTRKLRQELSRYRDNKAVLGELISVMNDFHKSSQEMAERIRRLQKVVEELRVRSIYM